MTRSGLCANWSDETIKPCASRNLNEGARVSNEVIVDGVAVIETGLSEEFELNLSAEVLQVFTALFYKVSVLLLRCLGLLFIFHYKSRFYQFFLLVRKCLEDITFFMAIDLFFRPNPIFHCVTGLTAAFEEKLICPLLDFLLKVVHT